jgi:hypothetical protein
VDRNGGERRSLVVTERGLGMTGRVRSVAATAEVRGLGFATLGSPERLRRPRGGE